MNRDTLRYYRTRYVEDFVSSGIAGFSECGFLSHSQSTRAATQQREAPPEPGDSRHLTRHKHSEYSIHRNTLTAVIFLIFPKL